LLTTATMNSGPRQRLNAAEYRNRQQQRQEQEEKEVREWERDLEDDGAGEIMLLYFGIATVGVGMIGLYFAHTMYTSVQPLAEQQQQQ